MNILDPFNEWDTEQKDKIMKPKKQLKAKDWEIIAKAALQRNLFAIRHLKSPGTGLLYDKKTTETRPWYDYFIESIEMFPGMKCDREAIQAMQLPRREMNRWFKKNRPQPPVDK